MRALRASLVALVVLAVLVPMTGCKWLESMISSYVKNRIDGALGTDKVSGVYDAPWTLSEDTCRAARVGTAGTSHIQINAFDFARKAAVLIDGWIYLPEAAISETTVSGTAEGTIAEDGTCDSRYTARVELQVDAKAHEIAGTIELETSPLPECAQGSGQACQTVTVY